MAVHHPQLTSPTKARLRRMRDFALIVVVLVDLGYGAILYGESRHQDRLDAQNARFCELVTGADRATQSSIAQLSNGIAFNQHAIIRDHRQDTKSSLADASARQVLVNKSMTARTKQRSYLKTIQGVGCPAPPTRTTHH